MRIALWIMLFSGVACRRAEERTVPMSLEDIATAWSAGTTPTCSEATSGVQKCEWPWLVTPVDSAQLTGELVAPGRLLFISWNRRFVDSIAALQLRDSLSQVLLARGLQEQECRHRGRFWEAPALGVHFVLDTVPGGRWVASVFATTKPKAVPRLFCPAAPPIDAKAT
jgi:hypothetical protein